MKLAAALLVLMLPGCNLFPGPLPPVPPPAPTYGPDALCQGVEPPPRFQALQLEDPECYTIYTGFWAKATTDSPPFPDGTTPCRTNEDGSLFCPDIYTITGLLRCWNGMTTTQPGRSYTYDHIYDESGQPLPGHGAERELEHYDYVMFAGCEETIFPLP